MSRTNHYRICRECTPDEACYIHRRYSTYQHKPSRLVEARRTWKRKPRWPRYTPKIHHNPPLRWWWQEAHAKARAIYRRMMREEDPALPRERDLIDLYGWY